MSGTVVTREVDAGPLSRYREGKEGTHGGERGKSPELEGHQKVWGERTTGIETEAAPERGHTVGGGIAKEGNGNGQKDCRETRTQRDLYREQNT